MEDGEKPTLIVFRRALTDSKAVLAVVMAEASFEWFRSSMVAFKVERRPSCPSGSWELVAIVEIQGSREKVVWNKGYETG